MNCLSRSPLRILISGLLLGLVLWNQPTVHAQTWILQGPGPTVGGQDEGVTSPFGNKPVSGGLSAAAVLRRRSRRQDREQVPIS